jgi:hypothetical protein
VRFASRTDRNLNMAVAEYEGMRGRVRKEIACATVRERFAELDAAAMAIAMNRRKNRERRVMNYSTGETFKGNANWAKNKG